MIPNLPLWAGLECTVNRIGSQYFNQCEKNGHDKRLEDLELFAKLGIERIRYPFLWELASPERPDEIDWTWADQRMEELRRLNLKPIVGFCHHGSGPKYTSLLDPEFPEKLAYYALRFAQRYPDVTDYTPINEPLTTARFSGLYGVWFPHHKRDQSFLFALYTEIKATILAMRAIREVNPNARLIQTEDMGRAQSTAPIKYQMEFENNRRWLSFDLLCGKVNYKHPLYKYLTENGLSKEELKWIRDHKTPPDVIGLNHYLLSNRFLDHRLEFYPEVFHGGNEKDKYADVGVVDTTAAEIPSPESIFQEAWDRYQIPLAVTEAHLYGPRESQMRWLDQIYKAAHNVQQKGVEFKAVTAWSLLGSYDWNTLCTQCNDFYESGVFDLRAPKPRPTVLATMIKTWSENKPFVHPVLEIPGWWKDSTRGPFGPPVVKPQRSFSTLGVQPLLIIGANGTLGRAFARICERRGIPYRTLTRQQLDICREQDVRQIVREIRPWAIINSAGYVRVDDAERESDLCFQYNVQGPKNLAVVAAELNIPLMHFSSDLVFDGSQQVPYVESHTVSPLNVYGQSKAESEKFLTEIHDRSLILRTSSFFGPWDQHNFVYLLLKAIHEGRPFAAASDVTISPTYVPDLVDTSLDLLLDGETGILHLTNRGHVTWAGLAKLATEMYGKKQAEIIAMPSTEMGYSAKRPLFSALDSERARIMPHHENALERYFKELELKFENLSVNQEITL